MHNNQQDYDDAILSALQDLMTGEFYSSASMLYEVSDPFLTEDALFYTLNELENGFERLLMLASRATDKSAKANIGQFLIDESELTAKNLFRVSEILPADTLTLCLSERASELITDELFSNSEKFFFEQQYLGISDKAQLQEVLTEECYLLRSNEKLLGSGRFYVSTSISSFLGEYICVFDQSGLEITSAEIDVSPFFDDGVDE